MITLDAVGRGQHGRAGRSLGAQPLDAALAGHEDVPVDLALHRAVEDGDTHEIRQEAQSDIEDGARPENGADDVVSHIRYSFQSFKRFSRPKTAQGDYSLGAALQSTS